MLLHVFIEFRYDRGIFIWQNSHLQNYTTIIKKINTNVINSSETTLFYSRDCMLNKLFKFYLVQLQKYDMIVNNKELPRTSPLL